MAKKKFSCDALEIVQEIVVRCIPVQWLKFVTRAHS